MKVLPRISNKRTDLADMFKLLLSSGSWNNYLGRNMVLSPSHFIVITYCVKVYSIFPPSWPLVYTKLLSLKLILSSKFSWSLLFVICLASYGTVSVCECSCGPDLTVSTQNASSLYGRSSSISAQNVSSTYKTQSNVNSSDNISSSVTSSICYCPCGLSTSAMDPTCKYTYTYTHTSFICRIKVPG